MIYRVLKLKNLRSVKSNSVETFEDLASRLVGTFCLIMSHKKRKLNDGPTKIAGEIGSSIFNIHFFISFSILTENMSDCDPDETESIDPNSLIAMPHHIKEDIFNFLELADRKSLS